MPFTCSNSRCRCDFSSRAPRKPNLSSIEIVSDILYQAIRKTAERAKQAKEGLMSEEEIQAADNRLTDWLGTTFCGRNRHYESGEDWNPKGLAEYIRDSFSSELNQRFGEVHRDDEEVIVCAGSLFLKDIYTMLEKHEAEQGSFDGAALSPPALRLVNWWSRLFTGAPIELLIRF